MRKYRWLSPACAFLAACLADQPPEAPTAPAAATAATDPVELIGAGDIASCNVSYQDEATASLIQQAPKALVFTAGDNAYPDGTADDYACFHASWGRSRTESGRFPGITSTGSVSPVSPPTQGPTSTTSTASAFRLRHELHDAGLDRRHRIQCRCVPERRAPPHHAQRRPLCQQRRGPFARDLDLSRLRGTGGYLLGVADGGVRRLSPTSPAATTSSADCAPGERTDRCHHPVHGARLDWGKRGVGRRLLQWGQAPTTATTSTAGNFRGRPPTSIRCARQGFPPVPASSR